MNYPSFKKEMYFASENRERYGYNAYVLVEEAISYRLQRLGLDYEDSYNGVLDAFREYASFIFGD